ncbi:MAG: hypothetical protein K0S08_1341 [Gammaproteobacteria bacterium]|nr:hypothetical protein [Gammaproteobacteria bacterium]
MYKITPDPIEFNQAIAIARQHGSGAFAASGTDFYWMPRPAGAVYKTQVLNFARILIDVIKKNRQVCRFLPDTQIQIVLDNIILPPLLRNMSFAGLILDHCQLLGDYAFSEFTGVQFLDCQFPETPTYIKFGYDGKECWQENLDFKAALYVDKSRQASARGDLNEAHALSLEAQAFQAHAEAIRLKNQALYDQSLKLRQKAARLQASAAEQRANQDKGSDKENEGVTMPISTPKRTSGALTSSIESLLASSNHGVLGAKRLKPSFFALSYQSPTTVVESLRSSEQTPPSGPFKIPL